MGLLHPVDGLAETEMDQVEAGGVLSDREPLDLPERTRRILFEDGADAGCRTRNLPLIRRLLSPL
jgi:hypothetical protein